MPTSVTRSVSEGERFTRLQIHRVVKHPPSLTLRVNLSLPLTRLQTHSAVSRIEHEALHSANQLAGVQRQPLQQQRIRK